MEQYIINGFLYLLFLLLLDFYEYNIINLKIYYYYLLINDFIVMLYSFIL